VEEQFYLFWAPAMKRVRERVPALCWTVLAVSATLYCLSVFGVFGDYEGKKFVGQLKFHFMAAGGLCAWWLQPRALARAGRRGRPDASLLLGDRERRR
jgi:hypothetical protein